MPLKIVKTTGSSRLWKPSTDYDKGSVIVMENTGRAYLVEWDDGKRNRRLLRLDDSSFVSNSECEYGPYKFREVNAELRLEL